MSTLYNLEPNPTAKVLLQTTAGDLELELFAKQTPEASRNFLQLCLDGYYDNTIFHRLVPKFIIQGGDPTGTGDGGESSYDGEPFKDEFHSRLKFNRRGLLGMANTGRADDNGSQFFLTLSATPELNNKNTMFGRIVGDTIYNLMKIGEAELTEDGSERPLYPTKVLGTEIIINPFEDMVKRVKVAQRTADEPKPKSKPKRKAGKALLSFGGEDGDGDDTKPIVKKTKFNPKFGSGDQKETVGLDKPDTREERSAEESGTAKLSGQGRRKSNEKVERPVNDIPREPPPTSKEKNKAKARPSSPSPSRSPSPSSDSEDEDRGRSALDRTNEQIEALKASMKRSTNVAPDSGNKKKSALEAMIPTNSTKGRRRRPGGTQGTTADENESFNIFKAFKNKLEAGTNSNSSEDRRAREKTAYDKRKNTQSLSEQALGEEALCDLHFIANCQSCTNWDEEASKVVNSEENDAGWMSHSLSFAKDRLGKDLEWKRKNKEELIVIDPLEKARELKVEKRKPSERHNKGKGRARQT